MDWLELPSARPYAFRFRPEATALVLIDMQLDFLDPGGFGAIQCGNDEIFDRVREVVPKTQRLLQTARGMGLHIFHTREGHESDLSDLPASKRLRQVSAPGGHHTTAIGEQGLMGRLLVRGEYGHDIVAELRPVPGEVVIDKPGKGSFWSTTFHRQLLARGVTHLLVAGVTTECCVSTTAREAADRGFECCVFSDCTAGFEQNLVRTALDTLCSYDGLFGFVGSSTEFQRQVSKRTDRPPTIPETTSNWLSLGNLQDGYRQGGLRVADVVGRVSKRVDEYKAHDSSVWTYVRPDGELAQDAKKLENRFHGRSLPPLYGIPFAVKDNIDVAGVPTTTGCEAYTYTPTENAKVVNLLVNAGALFIGKTNMDQLATGLSGCRSPFGTPKSVYGSNRISGGSSSGSAVAVGAGLVSFSLATDTAGSGRVPAALNGIVGAKPTKGTVSSQGLVPACRTLDTISVMTMTVPEARSVWLAIDVGEDTADAYAKPQQSLPLRHTDFRGVKQGGFTFGLPPQCVLQTCDEPRQALFSEAVGRMRRAGGVPRDVDWTPFQKASDLLYTASLVQERIACIGPDFISEHLESFHPTTRTVFKDALNRNTKAWEVFQDLHLKTVYTHQVADVFQDIDVLFVPSTPCHPTISEIEAEPLGLNARLGDFAHCGNVLDLCGIAVPAAVYRESGANEELPFGTTLLGAMGTDGKVFDIATEFERTS